LWLPSLINISALYWGLIYRVRYSVLLVPAVSILGSLVLISENAKKRALLLLALAPLVLPWVTWRLHLVNPADAPMPGPGALVLPVAGLIIYLIARSQQSYSGAIAVLCILSMQLPPLAREDHPMMVETMEHEFIEPERKEVLQYLRRNYDAKKVLIDMGTEAPLVYDSGLAVREFVYNEGGEALWHQAAQNPEPIVGWLCTQPGDQVSRLMDADSNWARNYIMVLKTEHYRLYRLKINNNSEFEIRN
jgi:hypothetical protein